MDFIRDLVKKTNAIMQDSGLVLNKFAEETPVLNTMPFSPANNGLKHLYTEVLEVDSLKKRNFDGAYQRIHTSEGYKTVELENYGGYLELPDDTADKIDASTYFAQQLMATLPQTGQNFEKKVIDELRKFAIAKGNVIDAGGTSNNNYTFYVVTWQEGVNQGLYDGVAFNSNTLFQAVQTASGDRANERTLADGTKELYHSRFIKTRWGIQLADERKVWMVANVDLTNANTDLIKLLTRAIGKVRTGTLTRIYAHPSVLELIEYYKLENGLLQQGDEYINTKVRLFNGIPIIPSFNLPDGGEANV